MVRKVRYVRWWDRCGDARGGCFGVLDPRAAPASCYGRFRLRRTSAGTRTEKALSIYISLSIYMTKGDLLTRTTTAQAPRLTGESISDNCKISTTSASQSSPGTDVHPRLD